MSFSQSYKARPPVHLFVHQGEIDREKRIYQQRPTWNLFRSNWNTQSELEWSFRETIRARLNRRIKQEIAGRCYVSLPRYVSAGQLVTLQSGMNFEPSIGRELCGIAGQGERSV